MNRKLKHIISYACDKSCSYCINELRVNEERQNKDPAAISAAYEAAAEKYSHIMLSGGEPALNKAFPTCLEAAREHFETVSVITANRLALLDEDIEQHADDVVFSLHEEYLHDFFRGGIEVQIETPFYASLVYESYLALREEYGSYVMRVLYQRGFAGVTIRQLFPNGQEVDRDRLAWDMGAIYRPEDFSLRVHDQENCRSQDMLMLPNLTLQRQHDFVPASRGSGEGVDDPRSLPAQ